MKFSISHMYNSIFCRRVCAVNAKDSDLVEAGLWKWSNWTEKQKTYGSVISLSKDFKVLMRRECPCEGCQFTFTSLKQGTMFPWQLRKYKTFQSHISFTDKSTGENECESMFGLARRRFYPNGALMVPCRAGHWCWCIFSTSGGKILVRIYLYACGLFKNLSILAL